MVLRGPWKGYIKRVVDASEFSVSIHIGRTKKGAGVRVSAKRQLLFNSRLIFFRLVKQLKLDRDWVKKVKPQEEKKPDYPEVKLSPFIGLFVLIRNADGEKCTDLNTKVSKGKYGYIISVDEDHKTAKVAYQNTVATFPLRNLVSS